MTNAGNRPLALIIADGWGVSPLTQGNAIAMAHTPYYDSICRMYPKTTLAAAGESVGLPADSVGNAEVGHLNIGAGRVVRTDVARISEAVRTGEFDANETLSRAFARAATAHCAVHLIGLLSDGGVHSSPENLFSLLRMAKRAGLTDVYVHCFLDGRDVRPRTADIYVEALQIKMGDIGVGKIASLCGRFYAMDGGENWERTARAYTMLVHSEGERTFDAIHTIRNSFLRGISDEFIAPIVIERSPGVPLAKVSDGDTVIFFNHRPDTMRQLVRSLAVPDENEWTSTGRPRIEAVCLTEYDRAFDLPVAFKPEAEHNVLAQIFAQNGVSNFRVTETERAPHITYFFNGGAEYDHPGERHIAFSSLRPEAFESMPEMRSFKIANGFLRGLESEQNQVFIINLPAADLMAETGSLEKTVEAVQFVDTCIGGIVEKIREAGGIALLTSSHGGCEEMVDIVTGEPNRFMTANGVPLHYIDDNANGMRLRDGGSLRDIAPTMLGILGLDKPNEMTGSDLRLPTHNVIWS